MLTSREGLATNDHRTKPKSPSTIRKEDVTSLPGYPAQNYADTRYLDYQTSPLEINKETEDCNSRNANILKDCIESSPIRFLTFLADLVQKIIHAARSSEQVDIMDIITTSATTIIGNNIASDISDYFESSKST